MLQNVSVFTASFFFLSELIFFSSLYFVFRFAALAETAGAEDHFIVVYVGTGDTGGVYKQVGDAMTNVRHHAGLHATVRCGVHAHVLNSTYVCISDRVLLSITYAIMQCVALMGCMLL